MLKIGAFAGTGSQKTAFLLGGLVLVGSVGLRDVEAASSSFTTLPQHELTTQSEHAMRCLVGPCLSFSQLVDTRDHDDKNVVGERLKKDPPHSKKKADKSMKTPPGHKSRSDEPRGTGDRRDLKEDQKGGKPRSDEPRGTDDRRDLKDDQPPMGEIRGQQPDDRRQGGEHPIRP